MKDKKKEFTWDGSECFLPCVGRKVFKGDTISLNSSDAESLKKQGLIKSVKQKTDKKVEE